jgi:hypothetical protein
MLSVAIGTAAKHLRRATFLAKERRDLRIEYTWGEASESHEIVPRNESTNRFPLAGRLR